jgi:hypothetical protein
LSLWGVPSGVMLNGRDRRFVPPINFGALSLCTGSDRGVIRLQPFLDGLRSLLKRPLQWALRSKPPAIQIKTNRPDQKNNQEALLDVGPDGLCIPESKTQFHLIRRLVHNVLSDSIFLLRLQSSSITQGASSTLLMGPASCVSLANPAGDRRCAEPKLVGNTLLCMSAFVYPQHHRFSQLLTCRWFQFPGIDSLCFQEQIF